MLVSNQTLELVNALELSEGEITPDIETQMLEMSRSADQAALFLDRCDQVVAHLDSIVDQIKSKIKTIENAQDFVKSDIKKSIQSLGCDLEGDIYRFKLAKAAPKVIIDDEASISDLYLRTKVIHEVDKKQISEDLKNGVPVEGAHLEENFSLRKSINTKKIKDAK